MGCTIADDETPAETETVPEVPGWDSRKVRIALNIAAPLLARLLRSCDVEEEDVQAILEKSADRLLDVRSLVYGGDLTIGDAQVRGLLSTEAQLDRIENKLDQLMKVGIPVRWKETDPEELKVADWEPLEAEES